MLDLEGKGWAIYPVCVHSKIYEFVGGISMWVNPLLIFTLSFGFLE